MAQWKERGVAEAVVGLEDGYMFVLVAAGICRGLAGRVVRESCLLECKLPRCRQNECTPALSGGQTRESWLLSSSSADGAESERG